MLALDNCVAYVHLKLIFKLVILNYYKNNRNYNTPFFNLDINAYVDKITIVALKMEVGQFLYIFVFYN